MNGVRRIDVMQPMNSVRSRRAAKVALVIAALFTTTGCGKGILPIAMFAAAATIQTVQVVGALCAQEGVDCAPAQRGRATVYASTADPYSTAVDWSE